MAERKNSEKRIASNNKWTNAHYDRVNLAIQKGRKDVIKAHADSRGESINAFITRAIQEAIERDTGAPTEARGISLRHHQGRTGGRPGVHSVGGGDTGAAG